MWEYINSLIYIFGFAIIILYFKHYLPSYFSKKAENLATKEDVQEITRKTEQVRLEFQKDLEDFMSDLRFKSEYCYKQYAELYARLYAIVSQSEYYRYFAKIHDDKTYSYREVPFFELEKTETIKTVVIYINDANYNISIF